MDSLLEYFFTFSFSFFLPPFKDFYIVHIEINPYTTYLSIKNINFLLLRSPLENAQSLCLSLVPLCVSFWLTSIWIFFRYHGKSKALMYDVTKIISMIKGKRGEHRLFRLAENLCMNLILSLRDFFLVKKELKVK